MKGFVIAIIFILSSLIYGCGCTRIEPGYVGIKVNLYGSEKGVEKAPLVTGMVWYNMFSEVVYEYPTFMQTVTWTRSDTEGSPNDDSITFNSIEGTTINADISISYKIDGDKVPKLFEEFRQNARTLTWTYMRNQVRDAIGRSAETRTVIDIFGTGKQIVLNEAKEKLNTKLSPYGIVFDTVAFVGALRVNETVDKTINAVIEAINKATEAENKVRQAKAEADQQIESARGVAESEKLKSQGIAAKILTEAEAQAKANEIIGKSLAMNPNLIQWQIVKNWNGVLPQYQGGNALLNLPTK